jgi:hypothetical protein
MKRRSVLCLLIILWGAGCSKPPQQEIPATPAHRKLVELCKEEYNLDIVTKAFENTLWVYLPLDHSYLQFSSSREGPVKSSQADEKWIIKYLDGKFVDHTFQVEYDIEKNTAYTDNKGLATKTSEEYSQKQQFLFSAINRAYADIERKPGTNRYVEQVPGDRTFMGHKENATHKDLVHSYVKTDEVPDFFVVVIADIQNGIETRMYLYLQDLRRAFYDQGFGEEYMKRIVVDQPIGHDIIIDDKKGAHLNAYDLSWPEFLMKQMLYRTLLKYTFSSFPPLSDAKEQLTQIAAETVQAYEFSDFQSLHLTDLPTHTSTSISQNELLEAAITPPPLPGKLHRLKFEIGAQEDDKMTE